MTASTPVAPSPRFTTQELDMLAKTADALSAYLGKPVLAEVVMGEEGTEWVSFGIPVQQGAKDDDQPHVQLGGPDAQVLGNRGGLDPADNDTYDCLYLWAIQITLNEGERFVKLDQNGEETAWSDDLNDMLPFALTDEPLPEDDDDEDEDTEDDDEQETDADDEAAPLTKQPPQSLNPASNKHNHAHDENCDCGAQGTPPVNSNGHTLH
ncbi:hypothetical protein [Bordetella sp. 15P40C-2]|uniref:hypothetical protein n=1 Tax=Bordetella sp. 15P40C-2 TaxID=2572246 RepID=UPI001321B523|nr:hypothetical protein [Bordetella sp. 15P40C-2]MVW73478.1 hypothetical protein [Bordetella sp. 15P40C-2]